MSATQQRVDFAKYLKGKAEGKAQFDIATDPLSDTPAPPPSPPRSYADVATQASQAQKGKGMGKAQQEYRQKSQQVHPDRRALIGRNAPTVAITPTQQPPKPARAQQPPRSPPLIPARAIVLHGAPTKYKPGQMRRWIEEGNQGDAQILGIRWLLQEHRRARKLASSLVIYLKESVVIKQGLRMGRRIFRTTQYD